MSLSSTMIVLDARSYSFGLTCKVNTVSEHVLGTSVDMSIL